MIAVSRPATIRRTGKAGSAAAMIGSGERKRWKQRTGREMGSRALVADAAETWVCSYLSLALLAGGGLYFLFDWWWADAVGALAMLPVILWQGGETLGEAREHHDHDEAE